jgi:hypothetical protein
VIKTFDNKNLGELRNDLDAAFAAIRAKHGITIAIGRISYDPGVGQASTKLTMNTVSDPSKVNDPRAAALAKAEAEFKRSAASFGLKPEQFGAEFKFGRDTYKLAGLKPRSPKRPILGTSIRDGKTYIFPESVIAPLQSKQHKELFGIADNPAADGNVTCSNTSAFDSQYKPIGKCTRTATTSRKGFGRNSRPLPYCDECARLMDESRREMEAEARCS